MPKRLTEATNFENLKKQAKTLHRAVHNKDPEALERVSPYFSIPDGVGLQQIQLVLAREYGFESWSKLREQLIVAAFISESPEKKLSKSILRTDDVDQIFELLADAIQQTLGWQKTECFQFELSVGATFGIKNEQGQRALLKVSSPDEDYAALASKRKFQQWIHEKGVPCPAILVSPTTVGDLHIIVEEYVDAGDHANGHLPAHRKLMAKELVRFVELSKRYPDLAEIAEDVLIRLPNSMWPKPHNIYFNFEATKKGAEWIDEVGARYQPILDEIPQSDAVGHADWSAKHFRIEQNAISVIYDWDVYRGSETRIVGAAAVCFTYSEFTSGQNRPTISELQAFILDYEAARGEKFSERELQEISASAHYTAGYCARCEHAGNNGGGVPDARALLQDLVSLDLVQLLQSG